MVAERVMSRAAAVHAQLPDVRGGYEENASMTKLTWFRTGGAADVMYRPSDFDDLSVFMAGVPKGMPVTFVGVGSNLLIRDGGVRGVIVKLGKPFADIELDGDLVRVGGGALDVSVAAFARDHGIGGLEFLKGIPGSIGGTVRMNGGAYESEIADVFVEATVIDQTGTLRKLSSEDMNFSYRHSALPEDWIITSATLKGAPAERAEIERRMQEIMDAREESQPLRTRTGGSTFKNPDTRKAWQLIDEAGCRGLRRGGAVVSEKHCNFLINTGIATSADLEGLGEEVRRRVFEASGVQLEWEIRRIGDFAEVAR